VSASAELPPWVEEKLKEYAQKFKAKPESLREMLLQLYNMPFVRSDPQFKSDDIRFTWCLDVLHARLVQQRVVRDYKVIPYGAGDVRMTKQGPLSRLYALIFPEEKKKVNGVILFKGAQAEMVRNVRYYYLYNVKLSKPPTADNLFMATTFTTFDDGQPIPHSVPDFIEKFLGVKKITIAESAQHLSRKVDKYVDEFDLRAIEAVVIRPATGKRPSGTDWGFYVVTDGSVDQDILTPTGYVIPAQFTVWVPPFMMRYAEESKLLFIGTISPSSNKEIQMNAIYVHPIIALPRGE
jgi:hypothetical protein